RPDVIREPGFAAAGKRAVAREVGSRDRLLDVLELAPGGEGTVEGKPLHARPSPAAAPAGQLPATAPAKPAPSLLAGSVEPRPACPAPPPPGAAGGTVLSGPALPTLCPPAPHRERRPRN